MDLASRALRGGWLGPGAFYLPTAPPLGKRATQDGQGSAEMAGELTSGRAGGGADDDPTDDEASGADHEHSARHFPQRLVVVEW